MSGISGYSKAIFRQQPEFKFLCSLCSGVLRDPVQTECGHRYCRKCLEDCVTSDNHVTCEACRDEDNHESILSIQEINTDRAILRELNKCNVGCPNDGCHWKGLYKQYSQEHESSCPFAVIKCIHPRCRAQIRREHLSRHLEKECLMRPLRCQYCNTEVAFDELQSHVEQCRKWLVACQYCGKDILHQQITYHQDLRNGDCVKKPRPCSFKEVGCNEMIEEDKMKGHEKVFLGEHMLLLLHTLTGFLATVQTTKDESGVQKLKSTVDKQQTRIDSLTSGVQKLETIAKDMAEVARGKLENGMTMDGTKMTLDRLGKSFEGLKKEETVLHTKLATYEGIVAVLNNQVEQDAQMVQEMKRQRTRDRELIDALERKLKAQDRVIALKDIALAEQDLRIQALEMASYDGVLTWKIGNFGRKRNEAISGKSTSIYSPCFYSSRHGYKMCARIYLNGDGMGKGNHVSVFFTIMKGPFDALLRWPFRQKVTLMWLDQNNREHVIDAFRPDPTSNSFKRPVQDMNIASGCPLFMPLSHLNSPRHAYVKDDVAFLKVIVDISDLI